MWPPETHRNVDHHPKESFAMSQWVKCTFTRTSDNLHNVPGYINLGLVPQLYRTGQYTAVAFGRDFHDVVEVRETPEELLRQLSQP